MKRLSLRDHLSVNRYGDFLLTDAVRPGLSVPIAPRQGYRLGVFRDVPNRVRLPMISAAVSAEQLLDVFWQLLEPLGEVVHVVLESSHQDGPQSPAEQRREHIDRPILESYLMEFEESLLNDGCLAVAVLGEAMQAEVQLDEHKLLHIYAADLKPYRRVLKRAGVRRLAELPLISEAEHLHHTTTEYAEAYSQLVTRLGADSSMVIYDW
ncbi:MAG: hypothetical protein ACRCZF_14970 [Gemmataceae bacterium]